MGNQRGIKRRVEQKPFTKNENMKKKKKNGRFGREEKLNRSPSPSVSADSGEENSEIEEVEAQKEQQEEEVLNYKEPTMYDSLLESLRTKREEYNTDSEENEDDVEQAHGASDDENEGSDSEASRLCEPGASLHGGGLGNPVGQIGGTETDDDDSEASGSDEEQELRVIGQPTKGACASTSSFHSHLDHKLSKEEVDMLQKKKWTYKWVVDISNCKWRGTRECFLKELDGFLFHGLKPTLYKHWLGIYEKSGGSDFDSSKQRLFFSLCNSYRDILHHNKKPFYLKGLEEDSNTMDAYVMHSLNHIFRTRDLVKKNEAKLAKLQESVKADILNNEAFLDRGFTRPKVLILLPLASVAFRVVKRLIDLTPPKYKSNVEERERFYREFGAGVSEDKEDEDVVESTESKKSLKPSDFQALFGGNNNDHFMLGIKFTRRSIKLYGDFYSSDMIVASPLGLITKIGEAEMFKEKNVDYLSSIEILIVDHADVILMQNWSHVNTIVEQLNRIPSEQHGTDIMRIRQWYLDGQAPFYRQSIILSSHINPDINGLFNHHCLNHEGKVKLASEYKGILPKVVLQIRQIYERFDVKTAEDADDARFDYFTKKVFPKIKDSIQGGIMLFISSYFEFIRVRNFLKSQEASFCLLGEYTEQSDISRARVWFFNETKKIMLYTERAHFYHRYKIRGIQNLIIYSLPERKEFYPEVVNMLQGSASTVLFSRFDQLRLERIVGTAAAKRMITSDKGVFVFC
ncbi:protein NUCLEOLAR FACTOR 1 isoform X1 [Nicotiana tomentosiformis]|uniref:protein NUCLEOLAR FACTOR 1 isoform X1 n=2 Tax=Nicotiana tomentosiformis TaxID=4098 RepID=UPI00051B9DE6|nr:U3 small nucleolar RNA-associated protein 25 isoform X2 [Nicotiana tomentosiformis]